MKKLALTAGLAIAMGISSAAHAHPTHAGYLTDSPETVWRTGFGECWKVSSWTPEKATVECGAPAPAPVEPKVTTMMKTESQKHIVYFNYDSSVVGNISKMVNYIFSLTKLNSIELTGHADKLGSNEYNQRLSKKRVDAVSSALQAAGVDANKISTNYKGETMPVKSCDGMRGDSLVSCLGANRRVEVNITGQNKVTVTQ